MYCIVYIIQYGAEPPGDWLLYVWSQSRHFYFDILQPSIKLLRPMTKTVEPRVEAGAEGIYLHSPEPTKKGPAPPSLINTESRNL